MLFIASFVAISVSVLGAIVPAIDIPGQSAGSQPSFPAPPGYLLPWSGGELHSVTQGEETTLTHNGTAAYAFDFDLTYTTVVAARSGKVTMVRQDSDSGGCGATFSRAANYVVVEHGDGTSGLYLHLAQHSVAVHVGDLVDQGQPLAVSGETGLTCSDDDSGPGPHLHFQVERTEVNRYFTQSLPIAFDDIAKNGGVPQEGETYMSGNYGRGKSQKIKLTPHRVPREFNPVATPATPGLLEADPAPVPAATPPATDASAPTDAPPFAPGDAAGSPSPSPADGTPTPEPTHRPTRTPSPSDTPEPSPSDTPVPPTPVPPASTATPEPAATAVPTDPPATASPVAATAATASPEPSSSPAAP